MVINSERIKYERNPKCSCVNCKYYGLRRCKLGIVLFIDGICINKSELKLSNHDTFEAKGEILTLTKNINCLI